MEQDNNKPIYTDTSSLALLIPAMTGLYLLLASTLYLLPPLAAYDAKRLLQLFLLATVFFIVLISPRLRNAVINLVAGIPAGILWAMAVFFLLGLLSAVVSAATPMGLTYSLLDIYLLAVLLVMALILAACRRLTGPSFDRLAMSMIAFIGFAVGLQELIGVLVAWTAGYQFSYDIALTHFAHPRFYNQVQAWSVPLLTALPVVLARHRWAGTACLVVLGLHWYILLMTGSRGGTLSILTALAVTAVLFPATRGIIFKWQAGGIVLGLLIYLLMFLGPDAGWEPLTAPTDLPPVAAAQQIDATEKPASAISEPLSSSSPDPQPGTSSDTFFELSLGRSMMHTSGRIRLWRLALDHVETHPLLGIGPMNFACKGPPGREGSPHNFPMQLLSEWGVPATLIVIGLAVLLAWRLFLVLKKSGRKQNEDNGVLAIMLASSVLAAALHAGLSGNLITPVSQVTGMLICGWLLGLLIPRQAALTPTTSRRIALFLLLAMTATGFSALMIAGQELRNMSVYEQQINTLDYHVPRFWQSGKVCRLHQESVIPAPR